MAAGLARIPTTPRRLCLTALVWCAPLATAMAFPGTDESNPPFMPTGADLAAPDAAALEHQMGLTSGFASLGSAQGWTILPRLSAEEEFTDNVNEVSSPRRWDLTTIVAPGVAVLGDSDRVQLRLNYEPDLEMHLRYGDQNLLAQQLNAVGTLTVVPDLFFVDVRALAGTQAINGGVGGLGGLGQAGIGGITGTSVLPPTTGTTGLAKQNRSETSSVSVSPYMLYRFGDLATARLSVSLTRSASSTINGFAPLPYVDQGINSQTLDTAQGSALIQTGDAFDRFRDTFTANAQQGTSSGTGFNNSTRDTVSDRVDYQLTDIFGIYGDIGWEDIRYSGNDALRVNDMTWGFGGTYNPNPDTSVTLGYGHQNGVNTANASARYALTARTILTGSYTNGIGTQLEQVADQLNQAAVGNNGNLVNAQTGGALFTANNALGVQAGIYRYNTLTLGGTSVLNRDTLTLTASHSQETRVGTGTGGTSSTVTTGSFSWMHVLNTDTTASLTTSYSIGTPTGGGASTNSTVAALSLQHILSDTVSTFARYNFYDVRSSVAANSWYQDVFLIGITKQF